MSPVSEFPGEEGAGPKAYTEPAKWQAERGALQKGLTTPADTRNLGFTCNWIPVKLKLHTDNVSKRNMHLGFTLRMKPEPSVPSPCESSARAGLCPTGSQVRPGCPSDGFLKANLSQTLGLSLDLWI